jgi:phosphoglycerate dehydrogenase-like enzyme
MPKILLNLTDDSRRRVFHDESLARITALGECLPYNPKTESADQFRECLSEADAMLTCWGSRPLTADDLHVRRGTPLLVAHAAGSVRNFVPKDLLQQGVRLTQGAPAIALAVAQYTVGLMTLALRQAYYQMMVLKGTAEKNPIPPAYRDLEGLTVGLVGLSRVGTLTAELLRAYHCHILAYDPYCSPEKASTLGVELLSDLDTLLTRSEAISLHAPVTDETRNLIDARRIALMPPGTAFVNTARAALVDQDALFARAATGEIEVYVDVTTPEPLPRDHPAWQCPHIFITPHIAGPTRQTLNRMADYAISEIERYLQGKPLSYEVTYDRYDILA